MSLQARLPTSPDRLYSAARDVAHNFPEIAQVLANRLSSDRWRPLSDFRRDQLVTDHDLDAACSAFIQFVAYANDKEHKSMEDAINKSGWLLVNPAAQVIVMAHLGLLMSGVYYAGVRDASVVGDKPLATIQELVNNGTLLTAIHNSFNPKPVRRVIRSVLFWLLDRV